MASTKPRRFAEGTKVPANQTRLEIETLLKKYGATGFLYGEQNMVGGLHFKMRERHLVFKLKLVDPAKSPGEHRRRWRALLLVLKGKLESVEDDTIETFEEAFLAHTVTSDGRTVGEQVLPRIALDYEHGPQPGMRLELLPPSTRESR